MLSSYTFIVSEGTAERNLFKPNKRKIVVEGSNFLQGSRDTHTSTYTTTNARGRGGGRV